MPFIELEEKSLRQRGEQVRSLLQPFSRRSGGPAWDRTYQHGAFIIGTHDGTRLTNDYRNWRFATYVPDFRAMYFELWHESTDNKWCLNRAYLSLFKVDRHVTQESEFLCLHCDPNEPLEAAHAVYKRGPHLHINGGTPDPLPHSHIALQQEKHLDAILGSCDELTGALAWAIRMIDDEILGAIYKKLLDDL